MKQTKKIKIIKASINYGFIILGTFLMGFGLNVFLLPNNIAPSGFGGLSIVISSLLQKSFGFTLNSSIIYLILNAILFIFALRISGFKFIISTVIGILGYSLFMEVAKFNITFDTSTELILFAIYGGVIMGIGLGLVFRGKGSTGGSDMLASILGKKFPRMKTGTLVLIIDALVVFISMFVYGLSMSLYSLIAIYIMTKVSDVIVDGIKSIRAYYIVTEKPEEISEKVLKTLKRGVTATQSEGMYTHENKSTLCVLVSRFQCATLRQIVQETDENAFMFNVQVGEALGQGFIPISKVKKMSNKKINKLGLNSLSLMLDDVEEEQKRTTIIKNNEKLKKSINKSKKHINQEEKQEEQIVNDLIED